MSDTALGQGADVVLGLIEKCEVQAGSIVTYDNLFTSLPLLEELTELGISALGTLRQNRFHGTPVTSKTTLAKKPRGSFDFATDGKILVVSWLDNKAVTCVTSVTAKLLRVLPVILIARLNGGQSESRNELMYQC